MGAQQLRPNYSIGKDQSFKEAKQHKIETVNMSPKYRWYLEVLIFRERPERLLQLGECVH